MSSENPCIHAAFEEPCRCLQCFFGASKVKAETLISTGFLGFSSENAHFYGLLPVFVHIFSGNLPHDDDQWLLTERPVSGLFQAEKNFPFWGLCRGDGCVESVHHGSGDLEMTNDCRGKIWFECFSGGQRGSQSPLPAPDQVHARVLGGESLGWAGQSIAFKFRKGLADGRFLEELPKFGVVIEQPVANGRELVLLRHVSSGGDDHFLGADVEVEAGA